MFLKISFRVESLHLLWFWSRVSHFSSLRDSEIWRSSTVQFGMIVYLNEYLDMWHNSWSTVIIYFPSNRFTINRPPIAFSFVSSTEVLYLAEIVRATDMRRRRKKRGGVWSVGFVGCWKPRSFYDLSSRMCLCSPPSCRVVDVQE